MIVENDLGYGSVKAFANGEEVKFPSVLVVQRQQDLFDPISFDTDAEKQLYFNNMINNLDVTIQSAAVKMQGRFLIGKAAVDSHLTLKSFDVNDLSGKSETDLAIIFTLSLIAAQRVKEAFNNGESLDQQLEAVVDMSTALPILEGKRGNTVDKYRHRFLDNTHVVTFANFKDPISVKIKFSNCIVAFEGETAQYCIKNADDNLKNKIKADFDIHYKTMAADITADDLVNAENVLGIDIGEGTTDFVVFNNGQVNIHASTSLPRGYGNALEDAVSTLQNNQFNIQNRAELQEFLNRKGNPFLKAKQNKAKDAVKEQLEFFNDAILEATSQTLRKTSDIDVVYVYGGGAIPMADSELRNSLEIKLRAFNGNLDIPIVWINKDFCQYLNRNGLKLIMDKVQQMKKN